jgi:molecular chaperone GrpE (heat shock protein)
MEESGDEPEIRVVDKRHFIDIDSALEEAPPEKPRYPSYVEELVARMSEMERRFEEKKQQMHEEIARTKARLETDYERKLELAKQEQLLPFLEVLDNLERALETAAQGDSHGLKEGIEMTANLFRASLRAQGVEPIPALDQPFDPNFEQAVGTIEVADPRQDGLVLDQLQRGYRLRDQLLRPALVRVGRCAEP